MTWLLGIPEESWKNPEISALTLSRKMENSPRWSESRDLSIMRLAVVNTSNIVGVPCASESRREGKEAKKREA